MDDRRIAIGTAIKSLGDNRIGGYLVRWADPQAHDLHGEYFDSSTEFMLEDYPIKGKPILFHHGLDPKIGVQPIGTFTSYKADEWGLWAEGVLEERRSYIEYVKRMIAEGALDFSSGALPQSVIVNQQTKHIDQWCVIEGSATYSPADWRSVAGLSGTQIMPIKALPLDEVSPLKALPRTALIEAVEPKEDAPVGDDNGDTNNVKAETPTGDVNPMSQEEIVALIMATLEKLGIAPAANPDAMPPEQAAMEAVAAAVPPEELQKMTDPEQQKAFAAKLAKAGFDTMQARKQKTANLADFAVSEAQKFAPGKSRAQEAGAVTRSGNGAQAGSYIPELRVKSKYGNLSPEVISCAFDLQTQYAAKNGRHFLPGGSEEGLKAALTVFANTAIEEHSANRRPMRDDLAVKAHTFKADELDYTTQSGYGSDWVWTYWREQLIEKARRENVVFPQFRNIKMAAATEIHPVEWTDPTVYYAAESKDEADHNFASSTIPMSKVGTKNLTFNARKIGLRVGWSAEQEEDAIIDQASRTQAQSDRAIRDAIDYNLLNGDKETGGTNVNQYGTNPTGNERWLQVNGLVKLTRITDTALSKTAGGGALSLSLIRQARFKLGAEFNTEIGDMCIFVDSYGYQQLLGLDEFITMDKAGSLATAQKGQIGFVDGIPVLVTSQLGLGDANGWKDDSGGNNTLGRMVFAYKPYHIVGVRRDVTPFLSQADDGESWGLSLTMRMDFQTHPSNNGASILYNFTV